MPATRRRCAVAGCGRDVRAAGWCGAHLQRVRKHGDPLAHLPLRPHSRREAPLDRLGCDVPGCSKPKEARGLCVAHYAKVRRGVERAALVAPATAAQRSAEAGRPALVVRVVIEALVAWPERPHPLLAAFSRPAWHARAACRGEDVGAFFPRRGDAIPDRLRALCARCTVRAECLAAGMAEGPRGAGVWGGTSGRERRDIRLGRRKSHAPATREDPPG